MQVVIALVAVAILLLIGTYCLPVIQQNQRMRAEIYRLDARLQEFTPSVMRSAILLADGWKEGH